MTASRFDGPDRPEQGLAPSRLGDFLRQAQRLPGPIPEVRCRATQIASREGRTSGSFQVRSGAATSVLIDFDGEASLTQDGPGDGTGTYVLNPVIRFLRAS